MMMLWATVSALTALSKDFVGLLLTRFFLGVTEAPYYPGAVYILSVFYNRKEIATRIAILYTGNVLATAFAGLIAAGVFHGMDDAMGLAGWQWLFILQGVVTFVMSVYTLFLGPESLSKVFKSWLTNFPCEQCPDRLLCSARFPAHDKVADPRRASASLQPYGIGYSSE